MFLAARGLRGPSTAALFALLAACADGGEPATDDAAREADAPTVSDSVLSWTIPGDVSPDLDRSAETFRDFAWRSFVALNWPAGADGGPDSTVVIGASGDATTVWEGYQEVGAVFLPDAAPPAGWGQPYPLPSACQEPDPSGRNVFRLLSKAPPDFMSQISQPFEDGPVVDQDGGWVRYAVHLNRTIYDFVVNNRLYDRSVQQGFGPIHMPAGEYGGDVGAISLKSGWKVLSDGDDPGRFHVAEAWVYTPASDGGPPSCDLQRMGLVAFHIGHKTASSPQWIWSTFEQVDNLVPAPGDSVASFRDPGCDSCQANIPPTPPWDPTTPGTPVQIERLYPIPDSTQATNMAWQARLADAGPDAPWQYYQLVGVQWPRTPSDSLGFGAPTPQYLANALLETYIQRHVPLAGSSCIACHNGAATWSGAFGDYLYAFTYAQSPPQSAARPPEAR